MTSIKNLKSALRNNLRLAILCLAVLAALPMHAETGGGRTVKYSRQDIVPVHAKVRFSTLIVLPQNEEILDFATGDKDFWIINGAHNLCYVHPAQTGIRTDLLCLAKRSYTCEINDLAQSLIRSLPLKFLP